MWASTTPRSSTSGKHRFGSSARATLFAVDRQSITVFRSRLRDDVPDRYATLAAELETRAAAVPGFVEFKQFVAPDGERLALVTFADAEAEAAWRDDVEHRAAQREGRESFYAEYDIAVCEVQRRHVWQDGSGVDATG